MTVENMKMNIKSESWIIISLLALTSLTLPAICFEIGISDTPTCGNLNFFSFWTNAQDPSLTCVAAECTKAPYLMLSNAKGENDHRQKASKLPNRVVNKPETPPSIHIAVVACGDRLEETLVMIKSAVLVSQEAIHVHIFADDDLRPLFKKSIRRWPYFLHRKLETSIYPITYPEGEDAADWKKLFKPCATQRLFIPYVLPKNVTDSVLYVDTDILFMRPVEHIWNFFSRFNSSHISALAPEHEWDRQGWYNRFARHPYYGERGVNSGVMLMNLTRIIDSGWIDHIIGYYKTYRFNITWGDQDLINIFFSFYPEKLYVYPCHWNFRPDHCMYGLNCEQARARGISVVHGNRGTYHNEKQPIFKAIYQAFKNFEFGASLGKGLLDPLKKELKELETTGYCGRVGDVFTAQLERQLKLRKKKCNGTQTCDVDSYEPEDFELEEKVKDNDDAKIDEVKELKETNVKNTKVKDAKVDDAKDGKVDKETSQDGNTDTSKTAESQKNESPKADTSKATEVKEDKKADQTISESLFNRIYQSVLKNFPNIPESKLVPVLIEHLTRLEDARLRNKHPVNRPQEIPDVALLSGGTHEEMLGYFSSFKEMSRADDYLLVLENFIKKLQQTKQKNTDATPMHLVVVACGERLEEPIIMMKSAILLSSNFLNFHVFAEEQLQPQFISRLQEWPENLQSRFKLHIHDIQYPPTENEADWKKLFKKCATQRLFLPNIMTDVDSVIYVDTDILFLRPVDDLWARFGEFNSTHISGLSPEHEDAHVSWYKRFARHPYYPPLGVNSGVMLMNLTRMRAAKWLDYIVPYYHTYRYNTTWGDQDLINIFFHFFPDKLYVFPCDWNYRQDHCMYMHVCKRAEEHGVSILHGARGVYHNEKEMAFRGVYEAIRDYKFGTDIKENLLNTLRSNVDKAANTNCGKVGFVLSKQYEIQINRKLGLKDKN